MIKEFKNKYRFLSNFHNSPISYKGKIYPTSEHLFQSLKTKDEKLQEDIRLASTPGKSKKMGRKVLLRNNWEEIKDSKMYRVLKLKFSKDSELEDSLFDTGEEHLVEGNYWHDNYWGDCFCPKCKDIEGKNNLGKILMEIREEI